MTVLLFADGTSARYPFDVKAAFFLWLPRGTYFDRIGGAFGWVAYKERVQ